MKTVFNGEIHIGGTVITVYGTKFHDVQAAPNEHIPDYYSGIVDKPGEWSHGTRMGFTRKQVSVSHKAEVKVSPAGGESRNG